MPIRPEMSAQFRRLRRAAVLLPFGMFPILAGCSSVDRMTTSSIPMDDYRNRHPIVLAEQARRLDIFPAPEALGLDHRSASQVVEFGGLYRYSGQGPISVFVPADSYGAPPRERIAAIRQALAAGGAVAPLEISSYPVINRDLASPIRLSFVGLKAKVADACGQWPSDLASGSTVQGWENQPYWNFGCS
jgi:pilus assembly protein CpaD